MTAQLLYEIADPAYPNPDVVAHFDTLTLTQEREHRVLICGCTGSPPPQTLKVAINQLGGYRNTMTMVLTGLDIEEKAAWTQDLLFEILGGRERFEAVDVQLLRFDHVDASINAEATAHLRITVKDTDPRKVGRAFSSAVLELGLASYPGFHTTSPPTTESEYGVYWPALVPARFVQHSVVLPDGTREEVPHTPPGPAMPQAAAAAPVPAGTSAPSGPTERVPLGRVCSARSGDKGGNANVGLWARTDEEHAWLREHLTVERFRELLPEAAELAVRRYELLRLRALNFVVVGLLGEGVASSTRPDAQAKGLGEYLRSRLIDVPTVLLCGDPARTVLSIQT